MKDLIRRTPPVVLMMAVMLAIGVGYSIYKAADAFSPKPASPQYERLPSQAFAIPEAVSLVDPQKLTEARLPDAAYEQIIPVASALADSFRKGKLRAKQLERAGLKPALARSRAADLNSAAEALRGQQVRASEQIEVQADTSEQATARASFEIVSTSLGTSSLSLALGFGERDGEWKLYDAQVEQ